MALKKGISRLLMPLFAICLLFSAGGCEFRLKLKTYEVSDDFITMRKYEGTAGKYLGQDSREWLKTVYELEGMPQSDYLSVFTPIYAGSYDVEMNKNAPEPLLRFAIDRLEIYTEWKDGEVFESIKLQNKKTIAGLIERRKGEPDDVTTPFGGEPPYSTEGQILEARFHFDLPCELIFNCRFQVHNKRVNWICEDNVGNQTLVYDVTDLLSGYLDMAETMEPSGTSQM